VTDRNLRPADSGRPVGSVAIVVGLVAILAIVGPAILTSSMPSAAELGVVPVALLMVGLILHREPAGPRRTIGSVAVVVGVLGIVVVGVLLWALVNGAGRPY
jgi:drug/metabolite transporter (DMT)-like permease